ncbi:hypothetical protein PG999_005365 [Apiospora kogelbergensis]|uniref:Uncharacterized protein n=1 Tax=Apiospora kogelbergensis TaxID=1337665 RepID=A0AAW0R1X9_9PEZI
MPDCRPFDWTRNCTLDQDLPALEPYGDISGLGVIIGFVGTGYFVLILVILNFFLSYDPTQCPWPGQASKFHWRPNSIDFMFLRWVRRIKSFQGHTPYLQTSITKSILGMCDIQIVTGLSILIGAFILGPQCGLDAYHWQMIIQLAWFSAVTHLSGLFALRGHIASHYWAKYGRVGLMSVLLIMLLVATFPTLFFNWAERDGFYTSPLTKPNSPAVCYYNVNYAIQLRNSRPSQFKGLKNSNQFQSAVFSMFLLVFGFASRLVKLFGPLSRTFSVLTREPLSAMSQNLLRKISSYQSVYWLFCIVLWGTFKLLGARDSVENAIWEDENQWAFGQILPVLLLAGPMLTISGAITSDIYRSRNSLPYQTPATSGTLSSDSLIIHAQSMHGVTPGQSYAESLAHPHRSRETPRSTGALTAREPDPCFSVPPSQRLEHWLRRDSCMTSPWMVTCATLPCLVVCGCTVSLFAAVFNMYTNMEPMYTLSEFWVSDLGLIFFLLIDLPAACTWTVLLGLSLHSWILDQRRRSIKMFWFWVTSIVVYIVYLVVPVIDALSFLPRNPSDDDPMAKLESLLRPYVFPFVKIGVLYTLYFMGCLVCGLVDHLRPKSVPRGLDLQSYGIAMGETRL